MATLAAELKEPHGETRYGDAFDAVFEAEELRVIATTPRAPRMNAHVVHHFAPGSSLG